MGVQKTPALSPSAQRRDVIVIGAGIGGLAAAARLAKAGLRVTVLERHSGPGGKMRALPSAAGPVDTGPTVLTLRPVFEDLFASLGARLEDHVTLIRQPLIARHFWPDGTVLDLFDDPQRNRDAIHAFAGSKAAQQFDGFCKRARTLFDGFDKPVMQAPEPTLQGLTAHVLARPGLILQMAPTTNLAGLLRSSFDDPRLRQLFGRYATYVGGSPYKVPALLALIWHAELSGVWVVRGGMTALAKAIAGLIVAHGGELVYNSHVERIEVEHQRVTGVALRDGARLESDQIVFNGDPRALATGLLGKDCSTIATQTTRIDRSLSADVFAFAATPQGPELAYHNVFFRTDPKPEFDALARGERVSDPTIYVCAMDRGLTETPPTLERFETIANAPPLSGQSGHNRMSQEETNRCQTRTFRTLERFGLRFNPEPGPEALSTPLRFNQLFPGSNGSLYGQSPHGTMAAFQRPTAQTQLTGLYLAGGGVHPGAGVPMATLSGKHAAEAILQAQISTSPSRPTVTPGGISTGSVTTGVARSRSSHS